MAIAVSVASRSGLSASMIGRLAVAAETAGLDGFYVAESASDSFVLCQAALAATSRITIGTAVANARLRHPAAAAMATATLDEWSGGRFRLGLGVSNAGYNEQVLGMEPIRPLQYMRDYLGQMRRVFAAPRPGGDHLPVDRPAVNPRTPITIAAMQPRMQRLAGEVADGAMLSLTTPASLPGAIAEVAAGVQARSAPVNASVKVSCVLPCNFDSNDALRRVAGRTVVLGYARHRAAAQRFAASGFTDDLPRIVAALDRGDATAAAGLVDDAVVDDFVLSGSVGAASERINRYVAAGVDLPILFPVPGDGDWERAIRRTIDIASELLKSSTTTEGS